MKAKTISEDEERRAQDDIQKLTDKSIAEVDKQFTAKEAELMSVTSGGPSIIFSVEVTGLCQPHQYPAIAVVMDGNGRWRKALSPRVAGHKQGVEAVRTLIRGSVNAAWRC